MARPIAREAAMQLVFEQLFGGDATAQTLVDLIDYNPNEKDSTDKKDAQVSEKTGNPKDGKNDKPQT